MPDKKRKLVGVDKVAEAFGISERAVQRLVIYDGLPRINRGEYDLEVCLSWYMNHLHVSVCGCAGPCDGLDVEARNLTNARAERRTALREITLVASDLVGLKEEQIRNILTKAVDDAYSAKKRLESPNEL
jgi:hypothetical protein